MNTFRMALGICLVPVLFACCNKNNLYHIIEGRWELRRIESDSPPRTFTPGNGNIIEFTKKGYKIFSNGQEVMSGNYVLIHDPTGRDEICRVILPSEYWYRIIYDDMNDGPKTLIQVSKNTLSFISGCFAADSGVYKEYARE